MSYNGSGTFLINSAGQPVVANTVISATVFNALTSDLATGLSTAITKDGQTTITNNIPFGSNKITGLGSGTAAADAANLGQVQSTVAKLITVTGTDTITGSMSPQLTAYAAGQLFYFVANAANTGAVTLNVDSLGAKSITRDGSSALAAGDINSGEVVVVIYDGTRFQMINAANSFGNTTINGTLTVTGNTGLQANVSITSTLSVGGTFAVTGAATLGSTLAVTGKSDLPTVSTASINAAVALITTGTVTNLTASGASIASANIGNLQFTAASIASINAGVAVITNLTATGASIASANVGTAVITAATVTGASIASANVGTAVITTGTVTNLTSTSASVASINAAVALITTGTVTSLTSTGASIASANVGVGVITALTVTGASVASANVGTAVVTGLTVTGASIASVNVGAAVFSGNLTLNGGTANGVLYLDGSKVATSGSALRFDGTNLGIGTVAALPVAPLSIGDGSVLQFYGVLDAFPSATSDTAAVIGRTGGSGVAPFNNAGSLIYRPRVTATAGRSSHIFYTGSPSAERLRIDESGNVGIGITSPAEQLSIYQAAASASLGVSLQADAATFGKFRMQNNAFGSNWAITNNFETFAGTVDKAAYYAQEIGFSGSSTAGITFATGASTGVAPTERMRLDSSGNLGIGTTSATFRLQVETDTNGNAGAFVRNQNTGASASGTFSVASAVGNLTLRAHSAAHSVWPNQAIVVSDSTFTNGLALVTSGATPLSFWTNSSERMRLDSSGNLGLGVTPSAWGSIVKAIEGGDSGDTGAIGFRTDLKGIELYTNNYWNGSNYIYKNTGPAQLYIQNQGSSVWYQAASGTAGNAITFTQAMTLDASGNLGISTTSPGGKLNVDFGNYVGVGARFQYSSSNIPFCINALNGTGPAYIAWNAAAKSSSDTSTYVLTAGATKIEGAGSQIIFSTAPSGTAGTDITFTERARITSAGELLVGTTTVAGGARVTSSGNIAISGSGTGARLRNQITAISVSTSAVTIIDAGDLGQLVVVNGNDGTNRFCDLVLSSTAVAPTVVQSFTSAGTPAARTYTRSGTNLQLALASGTYNVYALSFGF